MPKAAKVRIVAEHYTVPSPAPTPTRESTACSMQHEQIFMYIQALLVACCSPPPGLSIRSCSPSLTIISLPTLPPQSPDCRTSAPSRNISPSTTSTTSTPSTTSTSQPTRHQTPDTRHPTPDILLDPFHHPMSALHPPLQTPNPQPVQGKVKSPCSPKRPPRTSNACT